MRHSIANGVCAAVATWVVASRPDSRSRVGRRVSRALQSSHPSPLHRTVGTWMGLFVFVGQERRETERSGRAADSASTLTPQQPSKRMPSFKVELQLKTSQQSTHSGSHVTKTVYMQQMPTSFSRAPALHISPACCAPRRTDPSRCWPKVVCPSGYAHPHREALRA